MLQIEPQPRPLRPGNLRAEQRLVRAAVRRESALLSLVGSGDPQRRGPTGAVDQELLQAERSGLHSASGGLVDVRASNASSDTTNAIALSLDGGTVQQCRRIDGNAFACG